MKSARKSIICQREEKLNETKSQKGTYLRGKDIMGKERGLYYLKKIVGGMATRHSSWLLRGGKREPGRFMRLPRGRTNSVGKYDEAARMPSPVKRRPLGNQEEHSTKMVKHWLGAMKTAHMRGRDTRSRGLQRWGVIGGRGERKPQGAFIPIRLECAAKEVTERAKNPSRVTQKNASFLH